MPQLLSESYFPKTSLKLKGNIIAGTFATADVLNENGRNYKSRGWKIWLNRPSFQEKLKTRRVLGELGHPEEIDTTLRDVSHIVTYLELKPDGTVYGEAEILDTPSGKILKTLYEAGVGLGISSRGYIPEGYNLIPEDTGLAVPDEYELLTFDFVIDPSSPGAFPKLKEGTARNLRNLITESVDKLNSDVVSFVSNLVVEDSASAGSGNKNGGHRGTPILERAQKGDNKPIRSTKGVVSMADWRGYSNELEKVIGGLQKEYGILESKHKNVTNEKNMLADVTRDLSRRCLTSEGIIKVLRDYSLQIEEVLQDAVSRYKVSEEVIEDLRSRYTLAESVISDLRDYNLTAEAVIADIRDRYTLAEGIIEELRERLTKAERKLRTLGAGTATTEARELKQRVKISEDIIRDMAQKLKEKPKRQRVPEDYFEDVSKQYGISVLEAKSIFKKCNGVRAAYEYVLEEKKKALSGRYSEFPYMRATLSPEPEDTKVYEDTSETARVARLVAATL